MAAPYKPELFSIEDVENYFDISKGNCFRIYAGTNPKADDYSRGEYSEGDKKVAADRLRDCLLSLKQNVDNTNPYTLQVFNLDKKGLQADKNCIIFQLNRSERLYPYPAAMSGPGTDSRLTSLLEKQIEQQNIIISKLSAEEVQQPEEESAIGKILAREEVQTMLINGAMALISGFMSRGVTPPPTYGGGVAGTVDQDSVSLLQQLFNKGVTNETLQKLNEMSAAKLQSLLIML